MPSLFTVPPMTASPTAFATGIDSPVIMLSSALVETVEHETVRGEVRPREDFQDVALL